MDINIVNMDIIIVYLDINIIVNMDIDIVNNPKINIVFMEIKNI